jgi:hypothetical protein
MRSGNWWLVVGVALCAACRERPQTDRAMQLVVKLEALGSTAYSLDQPRAEVSGLLSELAAMGTSAREVTPALVAQAWRASWHEQYRFVQALTWMGDARAVPFLSEALESRDWRVAMAAVRALGYLGKAAAPVLARLYDVGQRHWLPRVRGMTSVARAQIRGDRAVPQRDIPDDSRTRRDWLESRPVETRCKNDYCPQGQGWTCIGGSSASLPAGINIPVEPSTYRYVVHPIGEGWLVGTDRGEWGGTLFWATIEGRRALAQGRMLAIVPTRVGLLVLSKVSSADDATVSVVDAPSEQGRTVRPFLELTGTPVGYRLSRDGGIVIATTEGTLIVGGDGKVAFECDE